MMSLNLYLWFLNLGGKQYLEKKTQPNTKFVLTFSEAENKNQQSGVKRSTKDLASRGSKIYGYVFFFQPRVSIDYETFPNLRTFIPNVTTLISSSTV